MTKFPAGTVAWSMNPTGAHDERPIVVLSHESRPYSGTECTIMCAGTEANKYNHYTPELEGQHLSGISFRDRTYLMPWALYTIPPGAIRTGKTHGELTDEGVRRVKKALIVLFDM